MDGFYVLRTPVPASQLDAPAVVTACKNLKYVERDFRTIKAGDLDLRPIFHRLEERVRAHVLICMLACYLTWPLRRAWAALTFTDENPPPSGKPVAPARRSARAQAKASCQHDLAGQPYRSFRDLLDHLATPPAGTPAPRWRCARCRGRSRTRLRPDRRRDLLPGLGGATVPHGGGGTGISNSNGFELTVHSGSLDVTITAPATHDNA